MRNAKCGMQNAKLALEMRGELFIVLNTPPLGANAGRRDR